MDFYNCAVCKINCTKTCSRCRSVNYCGAEHQQLHWVEGHKRSCKAYKVATSDEFGRHLRASRAIKKGEIVLREAPLVTGPKEVCETICLGCYRYLPKLTSSMPHYYKCSTCKWPLCGKPCEKSIEHAAECEFLASKKVMLSPIKYGAPERRNPTAHIEYNVILPIRCLLLQRSNPSIYEGFASLSDHIGEVAHTPFVRQIRNQFIRFVRGIFDLEGCDNEDLFRLLTRCDSNAYEIPQFECARGIYPLAAIMQHNCLSNTIQTTDYEKNIIFVAKSDIAKGEIITTSHTQYLTPTLHRLQELKLLKYIDCACNRCCDPTEFNTFFGSKKCSQCKDGYMVSTEPLNKSANWQCQLCPFSMSAKQNLNFNLTIEQEMYHLERNSTLAVEDFLYRYKDILHETHTYILRAKIKLIFSYASEALHAPEVRDFHMARVMQLCREVLGVLNTIDGGWSYIRAHVLPKCVDAMRLRHPLSQEQYQDFIEQVGLGTDLMLSAPGFALLLFIHKKLYNNGSPFLP